MLVELIYDLDCPNVGAARLQLMKAFAQSRTDASWTEWDRGSNESPAHARQYGSPTILVDGRDVAGEQPRAKSTCCRLYYDANGAIQGVPSVDVIAAALESHGSSMTPRSSTLRESFGWKSSLATVPGIALAFLPKLACPACWPAYAGLLSSLGLGFLVETRYLFSTTAVFLVFAVGALAFRARTRRGFGPFLMGVAASAVVFVGKFLFESDAAMYGGIGMLVAASMWNAWPRRKEVGCGACVEDLSKTVTLENGYS